LHRLFLEENPASQNFQGNVLLFAGFRNFESILYRSELEMIQNKFSTKFRFFHALSREEKNPQGGKMYIQDKIEEHATDIFHRMEGGAHLYFCGLRGMMTGIIPVLERTANQLGKQPWNELIKLWKEERRWHVEVY
jgi:ferredoxin--NADP+ reductase